MKQVLDIQNLSVQFGSTLVVNNWTFSLSRGECLAIVGESGSGKSVSAKAIAQLLPESAQISGTVCYKGTPIFQNQQYAPNSVWDKLRGTHIGFVFQEPLTSLNPAFTCGQQLAEIVNTHKLLGHKPNKLELQAFICSAWEELELPSPKEIWKKYPHELSGGQRQRVLLSTALITNPDVLIADEPTTALDPHLRSSFLDLLKQKSKEKGIATLLISHDLHLVKRIADSILVVHQGEMCEFSAADTLFQHPSHSYTQQLLQLQLSLSQEKYKRLPEKSKPPILYSKKQLGKDIIKFQDILVRYPNGFIGCQEVSTQIRENETVAFIGKSGSGKSTIAKAVAGLINFEGSMLYPVQFSSRKAKAEYTQMVFQDPFGALNPSRTVFQIISEPLKWFRNMSASSCQEEVSRLLELVHLPEESKQKYPSQFSGGQRQRISIARALACQARLLICDESTSALDISVQAEIVNLILSLQEEFQFGILLIAHDIALVKHWADKVHIMDSGRVVESGPVEQILSKPQSEAAKELMYNSN